MEVIHAASLSVDDMLHVASTNALSPRGDRLADAILFDAGIAQTLVLRVHHVVCDAWSARVLAGDLTELYRARSEAREPDLPPLPLQFSDYTEWQREALSKPHEYWSALLTRASSTLNIGPRSQRDERTAFVGWPLRLISPGTRTVLRGLARDLGTTEARVIGGAVVASLAPFLTDDAEPTITLGVMDAYRHQQDLRATVGDIADVLPIQCDLSADTSFPDLVTGFGRSLTSAQRHRSPWPALARLMRLGTDRRRGPLLDAMVNFVDTEPRTPEPQADDRVTVQEPTSLIRSFHLGPWWDWMALAEFQHRPREDGSITGVLVAPAETMSDPLAACLDQRIHMVIEHVTTDPAARLGEIAAAIERS